MSTPASSLRQAQDMLQSYLVNVDDFRGMAGEIPSIGSVTNLRQFNSPGLDLPVNSATDQSFSSTWNQVSYSPWITVSGFDGWRKFYFRSRSNNDVVPTNSFSHLASTLGQTNFDALGIFFDGLGDASSLSPFYEYNSSEAGIVLRSGGQFRIGFTPQNLAFVNNNVDGVEFKIQYDFWNGSGNQVGEYVKFTTYPSFVSEASGYDFNVTMAQQTGNISYSFSKPSGSLAQTIRVFGFNSTLQYSYPYNGFVNYTYGPATLGTTPVTINTSNTFNLQEVAFQAHDSNGSPRGYVTFHRSGSNWVVVAQV